MISNSRHIMLKIKRLYLLSAQGITFVSLVFTGLILTSCQSSENTSVPEETMNTQKTQPAQNQVINPTEAQPSHTPDLTDPEQLQKIWAESKHANTFVVSDEGENNSCARCHDRYNYIPSIEDIPESCFACKFEVDEPDPYISEEYWKHVDCFICHRVEKKEVQEQYAWLEFALIEEYSEVSSVTELCNKCHLAEDIPGHFPVVVRGDHPDYTCTECHNAHDLSASCSSSNCHEDVVQSMITIPGHDEDHAQVSCVACHDADELEIGFIEELGLWTTLIATSEGGTETRPFTSHNIVLEAPCERCHFPGNPWGLTETVGTQ
jgi:hypothetical protein